MSEQSLPAEELSRFGEVEDITTSMFDKVVETEIPGSDCDPKTGRVRTRLQYIDDGSGNYEPVAAPTSSASQTTAQHKPHPASTKKLSEEDIALKAVRDILVEERRAHSRMALPALPPVEETDPDTPGKSQERAETKETSKRKGSLSSAWRQIKQDTALLINASLWSFLAIVALGDFAISPMLILQGVFFLICFACVFRPEILAGVIRDVIQNFRFSKAG